MSILRPACYAKFKDLIDTIYKRFEREDVVVEKSRLSGIELEDYLYNTISAALGPTRSAKLDKDVDLFSFGVDSLQATRIRNNIQQELELGEHKLSSTGKLSAATRVTFNNKFW